MSSSLRRSMLFVPGNDPALLKDAHIYGADSLIFDLEDSVSPAEKDAARLLVYSALRSVDYGRAERVVRINGLDTPWARQDVAAMVRAGVQIIRLPKTESPADIVQLEALIARAELDCGRAPGSVGVLAALESPNGVLNARDIAKSSARLVGIALSAEDFVTSMKTTRSPEGVELAWARGAIVISARAAGIMAFDTVFTDVADDEGFLREARLAKQMGFDGKSLVNPSQVPLLHSVYAPRAEELAKARRVVAAAQDAQSRGLGVISLDGKMIDKPIVERARRVIDLAEAAGEGN